MARIRQLFVAVVVALSSLALLAAPAAAKPKADKMQKDKSKTSITVVYETSDNVAGEDAGDIDAVTYICYVYKNKADVTCGTVSN